MSIVLRNNRLEMVDRDPDLVRSTAQTMPTATTPVKPATPAMSGPLPTSAPSLHRAVLGDLSASGEVVPCDSITDTITRFGIVYHYCGVSDGVAYYRTVNEIQEIEDMADAVPI